MSKLYAVKPLEWQEIETYVFHKYWESKTVFGTYAIIGGTDGKFCFSDDVGARPFIELSDFDKCVQMINEEYENRLKVALVEVVQ